MKYFTAHDQTSAQVCRDAAAQLRIEDPSVAKRYTERAKTAYEHA